MTVQHLGRSTLLSQGEWQRLAWAVLMAPWVRLRPGRYGFSLGQSPQPWDGLPAWALVCGGGGGRAGREPWSWAVALPVQVFPLQPSLWVEMSSGSGEGQRGCQAPASILKGPRLWGGSPAQAASRLGGLARLPLAGCCPAHRGLFSEGVTATGTPNRAEPEGG